MAKTENKAKALNFIELQVSVETWFEMRNYLLFSSPSFVFILQNVPPHPKKKKKW